MDSQTLVQLETQTKVAQSVKFHLSLNVGNLDRSVAFFRVLLDCEPAKCRADYAKFELEEPPLVLSLEPFKATPGGNLNHVGFRMADSESLVEMQRRLELHGISTRREEGVECCYARQTKFWVHDPDGNMWEIYTLDEDLEHRGAGQTPEQMFPENNADGTPPAIWNHQLGRPFPKRLPILDATVDLVNLQGTLNEALSSEQLSSRLAELNRILKAGGKIQLHVLSADRPVDDAIVRLPGPASVVRHVPVDAEVLAMFRSQGFSDVRYAYRAEHACFRLGEAQLRETRIECRKPSQSS